jgi:uridine kinase
MQIIAIAGGSGSGKSTAAWAVHDSDPAKFEVLNLDDYHRYANETDLPRIGGQINWDDPAVINWSALLRDLKILRGGEPVAVMTKDRHFNPSYDKEHRRRLPRTVEPKPFLIIEGYLALYNPEVNALYDQSFYLDLSESVRNSRREKKIVDPGYMQRIGNPMHDKYVEPTKASADVVIDVSKFTAAQVAGQILAAL